MHSDSTRRVIGYYPPWTAEEKAILEANINKVRYSAIAALIPGRTVEAIKQRATMLGFPRLHIQPARRALDEDFFSRDDLLPAYWAGFIAADGCVITHPRTEVRIGIHQKDAGLLERFTRDVGYDGPISLRNRMAYVTVCAAYRWVSDLEGIYRIGPRKTLALDPPCLEGDLALAYSIGYIDGDGCWATHKGPRGKRALMLIVVGTKPILEWLRATWESAGADTGKSKLRLSRNIWRMSFLGSPASAVAKLLNTIPIDKLERKWRVARGEATGQERRVPPEP